MPGWRARSSASDQLDSRVISTVQLTRVSVRAGDAGGLRVVGNGNRRPSRRVTITSIDATAVGYASEYATTGSPPTTASLAAWSDGVFVVLPANSPARSAGDSPSTWAINAHAPASPTTSAAVTATAWAPPLRKPATNVGPDANPTV